MRTYKTPVLYSYSHLTASDLIGPYETQYNTTVSVGGGRLAMFDSEKVEYFQSVEHTETKLVKLEKKSKIA